MWRASCPSTGCRLVPSSIAFHDPSTSVRQFSRSAARATVAVSSMVSRAAALDYNEIVETVAKGKHLKTFRRLKQSSCIILQGNRRTNKPRSAFRLSQSCRVFELATSASLLSSSPPERHLLWSHDRRGAQTVIRSNASMSRGPKPGWNWSKQSEGSDSAIKDLRQRHCAHQVDYDCL